MVALSDSSETWLLSLGGTNLYMTLATLFIAQAMNVQLSCDDPATRLGPNDPRHAILHLRLASSSA